jgi:methylmalonyl-CoA mutase N-terminal domain/subunit
MERTPQEFAGALQGWRDEVGDLPRARLGHGGDHGDTGEEIEPLYTRADVELDEAADLGVPGHWPYTRGTYPTGYRKRPWLFAQYVGFGTAEETNERWKTLLAAGQRSVSLAFDLPSHLGYDSDHPLAEDEVGKAGVAVDSLADFEVLFDGIDLSTTPSTFNTAAIAPVVTALYQVTGERQGVPAGRLAGALTNDPLSSAYRGTCAFPSGPAVRLAVDVIEYCVRQMPRFTPINVQGVYMRSVGATKAQEAGYAMAVALAYLEEAVRRGLAVEEVAPRFSFFFQCDPHFFEEAAKFRAARRVWAELVRERFGTEHPDSLRLRATGVSTARCFTAEEPEINLVRGAYSALGCALGGVQGMWISGYDEAYATPTEKASRLALRTMQILAEETGVTATIDPLGGGYYIEHLTGRMAEMIRDHVGEVDAAGGAVAATDAGFMRQQMMDNDLRWLRERQKGERPIVAHNIYRSPEAGGATVEFQRFRPEVRDEQLRRLEEVRTRRDGEAAVRAVKAVREAAAAGDNLVPVMVDAVRAEATLGEIMAPLRELWGEWQEPAV